MNLADPSLAEELGVASLVVEDEPILSNMLQPFSFTYGEDIVRYNHPIRALETWTQQAENMVLVLSVETMLSMSGLLLAESMLKVKPALPIIVCTGFNEYASAESAAKMGIAGSFHKPLNEGERMSNVQALGNNIC